MEGCPAGDAGPVLNTGGGSDAQGFDYAILPPYMGLLEPGFLLHSENWVQLPIVHQIYPAVV